MNIRHYFLSNVYRSPDDPAVAHPDDVTVEPVAPVPDPAAPPVAAEPETPAPASIEAPAPAGQPWYMKRLSEESAKVAREREAREAAERRATDAEALAQRLQETPPDPAAPRPQSPQARQQPNQDEFQAAVRRQAQQDRLAEDSMEVLRSGSTQFKDFGQTREILNAVGALNDDFVADLLAVDKANAHVLLDQLAKDPEKAVSLTQMDGRRRIAELTRMSTALAPKPIVPAVPAPAPAPVSRAPKPAPALAPVGGDDDAADLYNEKLSDDEWSRLWDDKHKKRA